MIGIQIRSQTGRFTRPQALLVAVWIGACCAVALAAVPLDAEQPPLEVIGRTRANQASGELGEWGLTGTDLTIKSQLGEVWVLDGHSQPPFIRRFSLSALDARPRDVTVTLPPDLLEARVLGLAEIPHGQFLGANLILVDPTFAEGSEWTPHLGLIDDEGLPREDVAFARIEGLPPGAQLTSIDVHPTRDEIIAYDAATHSVHRLDFTFSVIDRGEPLLGFSNVFGGGRWFFGPAEARGAGMGIAFDGPDAFLLGSGFFNRFETHLALRYSLRSGVYAGTALDLRAAASGTDTPSITFVGMDTGELGGEPIVVAHNFADDALYVFARADRPHAPPVEELTCELDEGGTYTLHWMVSAVGGVEFVHVFENGVRVATVAGTETSYTSRLPLVGKAFIELASERDGVISDIRPLCQLENSRAPSFPGLRFGATTIDNIAPLAGVATPPLPRRLEDFRLYVVGTDSNAVVVLDHLLEWVETIQLQPASGRAGDNLAALGIALLDLDGRRVLALLDSDGPLDDNTEPSAALYALEGPRRGQLEATIERIDLSRLEAAPFLFDWDAGPDNQLVAGGVLPNGEYVLVRILFDGERMIATQSAPLPQTLLSSSVAPNVTGAGVSVLPSGYLLVAGSDGFSATYTEALVVTPFCDDPPRCDPAAALRFVGEAQGLFSPNQFLPGVGPGLGPTQILALESSFFAAGEDLAQPLGVTYIPTGDTVLVRNPETGTGLRVNTSNFLIHGATDFAHPDFVGEELLEEEVVVNAGSDRRFGPVRPSTLDGVERRNFILHLVNLATTPAAEVEVELLLDGEEADSLTTSLPAGRCLRRRLAGRVAGSAEVILTNSSDLTQSFRVLLGASGVRGGPVATTRFRRGDCDADGDVSLTDAVTSLNWLFLAGPQPSCADACDVDDGGTVDLTDAVGLLNYLFLSGVDPAAPGPETCGEDADPGDSLPRCNDPGCA